MSKYTVFDIANWFTAKAKSEGKQLKHSKLQNLVYFTYGWYFAYYDKQLFPEAIYARDHGTVVKELYHQCRHNKGQPLADDIKVLIIDEKLNFILKNVWESYAPHSDMYLMCIVQRRNSPWDKYFLDYEKYIPIPPKEIHRYFKDLKAKYETEAA